MDPTCFINTSSCLKIGKRDRKGLHVSKKFKLKVTAYKQHVTSFCCPTPLMACCWFCSSHCGAPPWTICSRNHTRLINAQSVHVTTKQPCKQSANKFSLLKRYPTHYTISWHTVTISGNHCCWLPLLSSTHKEKKHTLVAYSYFSFNLFYPFPLQISLPLHKSHYQQVSLHRILFYFILITMLIMVISYQLK